MFKAIREWKYEELFYKLWSPIMYIEIRHFMHVVLAL